MPFSMTTDTGLTGLATEVLRLYGVEDAQLTRLGGVDNANFRVDAGTNVYALHLYAARQNRTSITSELVWLSSLRSDLSLTVPEPVPNKAGELVSSITLGKTETFSTLMRWFEGDIPPTVDAMTSEQLEQTGTLMARLHIHSQGFDIPERFVRPIYDEAHFRSRLETLYGALRSAEFDRDDLRSFSSDAEAVLVRFGSLEHTPATFGLAHADFHSGNYLLHDDTASIIDFGRCGFGFYLHDLALALTELNATQRGDFLRGYEALKLLPAGYADLIETFLVLAYLDNLGTLASNPEELTFIANEMEFVREACQQAVASPA